MIVCRKLGKTYHEYYIRHAIDNGFIIVKFNASKTFYVTFMSILISKSSIMLNIYHIEFEWI
jgi:hypothetical protein